MYHAVVVDDGEAGIARRELTNSGRECTDFAGRVAHGFWKFRACSWALLCGVRGLGLGVAPASVVLALLVALRTGSQSGSLFHHDETCRGLRREKRAMPSAGIFPEQTAIFCRSSPSNIRNRAREMAQPFRTSKEEYS